jgi:hypothetical protein
MIRAKQHICSVKGGMMRNRRFMFLCSDEERRMLAAVARRLARTESDVVRLLIREAARELDQRADEEKAERGTLKSEG